MKEMLESTINISCCDESFTLKEIVQAGNTCPECGDKETYYSFCRKDVQHTDHDSHCSLCHECNDWHFWHCFNCNKCSYGQSIPRCEHCGASSLSNAGAGSKSKLKPLSFSFGMEEDGDSDEDEGCRIEEVGDEPNDDSDTDELALN